jgi:hypothetical protein
MSHEQALETSQFSPAPPIWLDELDELGLESLSWCVWGESVLTPYQLICRVRCPDEQDYSPSFFPCRVSYGIFLLCDCE